MSPVVDSQAYARSLCLLKEASAQTCGQCHPVHCRNLQAQAKELQRSMWQIGQPASCKLASADPLSQSTHPKVALPARVQDLADARGAAANGSSVCRKAQQEQ